MLNSKFRYKSQSSLWHKFKWNTVHLNKVRICNPELINYTLKNPKQTTKTEPEKPWNIHVFNWSQFKMQYEIFYSMLYNREEKKKILC